MVDAGNIFFDVNALKSCGQNVIIGKTARIRYPELVEIGDNVIIDDFTYISTALRVNSYAHIASGCKIIGGRDARVEIGNFSTLAPNAVLAAGSDDYLAGLATPMIPARFKGNVTIGQIVLGNHCIVAANAVVLPNVTFFDGACLGSLSMANQDLEAWCLYAGVPARNLKKRDKVAIQDLEAQFRRTLRDV